MATVRSRLRPFVGRTALVPASPERLVPPEVPEWVVHQGTRYLADMARPLVGLVAEREVLGGDLLRSLQGLRRPADQQPDVVEAHLQQPRAEPVLPRPEHHREL